MAVTDKVLVRMLNDRIVTDVGTPIHGRPLDIEPFRDVVSDVRNRGHSFLLSEHRNQAKSWKSWSSEKAIPRLPA